MNSQSFDAIVIGAGIVGAACADSLSREGLRVAIVERDWIGGGATGAAMGHVVVMDDSEAQFALTRFSQELWMQLRPELPAHVEYQQCGTLWIAAGEQEMQEVVRKHRAYTERGVPAEIIDGGSLALLEPNLRKGLAGALLVSQDIALSPPSAAQFLIERAQRRGAEVFLSVPARAIENGALRLSDGTRLRAAAIVNATGTWASGLTSGVDIRRRKGHLVITDPYPNLVRHQLVELAYLNSAHKLTGDSVAFNLQPRSNGQILIGSSRQFGVESEEVDHAILEKMLQRAIEYMPCIATTSLTRTWTGFRAATPDKLPLIGPWPETKGLFLATGHEGLGITTSLGTAALITAQILGSTAAIPAEPYLPARASIRKESYDLEGRDASHHHQFRP